MNALIRRGLMLFIALFSPLLLAGVLDSLSPQEASQGLKEALSSGASVAVQQLGSANGFLGNDKVRIPLPEKLQAAEKAMRMLGMKKQADELIDTMNRAAEQAVAEAKPILLNSIQKMSVTDAKAILTGGEDSVTQFFKKNSSEALAQKFAPIVAQNTQKLALADRYNQFAGKAAKTGLLDSKDANLDQYITQKAMDGLFLMIAEQEKNLRSNPLGAGTPLLKKVFGAL